MAKTTAQKIEKILGNPLVKILCKILTKKNVHGKSYLSRVFQAYGRKDLSLVDKITLGPVLCIIDHLLNKWKVNKKVIVEKVFHHPQTNKAIVTTLHSIGKYGLTLPQVFSAPLMVVWNFTNACNLKCIHCYQDSKHETLKDELSLEERLKVVDEMVYMGTVMVAFSGGEPLLDKDFWPVAEYAAKKGLHVSVATNGTLVTKENAQRLYDIGVRYVEISVDSVNPETHDKFRGAGCFNRAIQGIKNIVEVGGIRVGLASTITRLNYDEVDDLIGLAKDLKCEKFCAFNFIPTGRAQDIVNQDITPKMREKLLEKLYDALEADNGIDIMTTAPQISRVCLYISALKDSDLTHLATAHIASASGGLDLKTFAKYMGGCGAGRCYWAIQPNGKVTPCVFIPSEVGDLRKQTAQEIWDTHALLKQLRDRDDREGGCLECDYKLYCGGCRARPFGYYGDVRKSDPGCIINENEWNELVQSGEQKEKKVEIKDSQAFS